MIVHLFPCEKFTTTYVNLINNGGLAEENFFILYGNTTICTEVLEYSNVCSLPNIKGLFRDTEKKKLLYKSDGIILHSLFSKFLILFFYFNKKLLYKTNWVIWGGDMYDYINDRHSFNLNKKIKIKMKKFVVERFGYITPLVKGDYLLAQKWYNAHGEMFEARYTNPVGYKELDKYSKEHNGTNILIGNSATATNNHEEVFNLLSKYSNEDIKVYVPLSYGDESYAEKIVVEGTKIFGNKFVPMRDFMTPNDYVSLLATMDIAIFNNDRQQALGNINMLMYLGSKIFLRTDTTMWDHYKIPDKDNIIAISTISNTEFTDFVSKNDDINKINKKFVEELVNEKKATIEWKYIFDTMSGDGKNGGK